MRVHALKLLAATLATFGLAACSDISGPNTQSATGTYVLQTVNGNRLPYTFNQNGTIVSVQSDTYALNSDYTYSEYTNETVSNGFQNSGVTRTEYGNWSQNNNAVAFSPISSSNGSYASYTGSLSSGGGILGGGADLTISINGTVSIYSAQ